MPGTRTFLDICSENITRKADTTTARGRWQGCSLATHRKSNCSPVWPYCFLHVEPLSPACTGCSLPCSYLGSLTYAKIGLGCLGVVLGCFVLCWFFAYWPGSIVLGSTLFSWADCPPYALVSFKAKMGTNFLYPWVVFTLSSVLKTHSGIHFSLQPAAKSAKNASTRPWPLCSRGH